MDFVYHLYLLNKIVINLSHEKISTVQKFTAGTYKKRKLNVPFMLVNYLLQKIQHTFLTLINPEEIYAVYRRVLFLMRSNCQVHEYK